MARLSEQDVEAVHLKEVRDELVFILESSGVERFELEINSDYHGQERLAEAVKEKEYCYDRRLAGKIAEVVRAGYQYFIDDKNFKVVRPAQVKLFG
jgi:molecular chaperone GrpE (heat shock protein)